MVVGLCGVWWVRRHVDSSVLLNDFGQHRCKISTRSNALEFHPRDLWSVQIIYQQQICEVVAGGELLKGLVSCDQRDELGIVRNFQYTTVGFVTLVIGVMSDDCVHNQTGCFRRGGARG
ncbi:hypothetical protein CLF_103202 [Clonorchis sinensis]|uniref:Uncharacterized protein n=1 Tax=Clonorchis sinensis TaxID=79923 RepID=G7Y993_CLOSI|nr:hypothetical protein CLF_103202 [Clonorchis sinensis]